MNQNIQADITSIVLNVCDEILALDHSEENVEIIKPRLLRSVLKIMQGLEVFTLNNDWKR